MKKREHCLCDNTKQDTKKSEDHFKHLKKWNPQKIHKKLGDALGREPGELLMNVSEDVRSVKQEKRLLDYCRINTYFDKFRGNPTFWSFPNALKNKGDGCSPKGPTYYMVKTKAEKNERPEFEYVAVPPHILKEKDVWPRSRSMFKLWKNSDYKNSVMKHVSSKVKEIQPHKPQTDDLVIVGHNVDLRPAETVDLETFEISVTKDNPNDVVAEENLSIEPIAKRAFQINNLSIYAYSFELQGIQKIYLRFDTTQNSNTPAVQTLRIKNIGNIALRFCWWRYEKFKMFRDINVELRDRTSPFCFNDKEILLIPGQETYVQFWFRNTKPGRFVEYWELNTDPIMWEKDEFKLLVVLQGYTTVPQFHQQVESIHSMLERNAQMTQIADILNNMLSNIACSHTSTTVTYTFCEEQLFESANIQSMFAENVSKYIYNKEIVSELKKFYENVRLDEHPKMWDFCVKSLKRITRERDLADYAQKKVQYRTNASNKRMDMKQLCELPNSKTDSKKNADKQDKANSARSELDLTQHVYYKELTRILQNLERPVMLKNVDREKYAQSYFIMRTYMTKMCNELEDYDRNSIRTEVLKRSYFNECTGTCSPLDPPERLIFERFNDIFVLRTKLVNPQKRSSAEERPKTEVLKKIPPDDVKKIFKAYFEDDKSKRKDGEKGNVSSRTKSDNKGDEQKALIIEGFDPFREEPESKIAPRKKLSNAELRNSVDIESQKSTSYKTGKSELSLTEEEKFKEKNRYLEKYLIVYTNLTEAIGTLVDNLEEMKQTTTLDAGTLSDLMRCGRIRENEDVVMDVSETEAKNTVANNSNEDIQTTDSLLLRKSAEDEAYYQYLLNAHWKENENTKKYIVNEEKLAEQEVFETEAKEHIEVSLENDFEDWLQFQRSRKEPHVSYNTYMEKQIQTSECDVENMIENDSIVGLLETSSTEQESCETSDDTKSVNMSCRSRFSDLFYLLPDG